MTRVEADDATRVAIVLIGGHAFVEIGRNYLLRIGTEEQVRRLSEAERWALVNAMVNLKVDIARGEPLPISN